MKRGCALRAAGSSWRAASPCLSPHCCQGQLGASWAVASGSPRLSTPASHSYQVPTSDVASASERREVWWTVFRNDTFGNLNSQPPHKSYTLVIVPWLGSFALLGGCIWEERGGAGATLRPLLLEVPEATVAVLFDASPGVGSTQL